MAREETELESSLAFQIKAYKLPPPVRELEFAKKAMRRMWRFDFAWPALHIAAEIEGGVWVRGRHTRPGGFTKDAEKYNAAAALGWRVLRFTNHMVEDGRAIDALRAVLSEGGHSS